MPGSPRARWPALAIALAASMVIGSTGCKEEPAPAAAGPPAAAAIVAPDRKLAWIARLEEQRMLRDADVTGAPVDPANPRAATLKPASTADLEALSRDPDAGIRRRAVVAIGRVGQSDGLPALVAALQDAEVEVRAAAAFSIGLLGPSGRPGLVPLETAVSDAAPLVRARAIQGIGLVGDASAAPAVVQGASGCDALLPPIGPDEEEARSPEIEVCRQALFALVRLGNYDALSRVALDGQGRPAGTWWPVAYALQRSGDRRAAPALESLAAVQGVYTASFALRGLADLKDSALVPIAKALVGRGDVDLKLRVAAVRALGRIGGPEVSAALVPLLADASAPVDLTIEVLSALGTCGDRAVFPSVVDFLSDPAPAVRAAALSAAAKIDQDAFLLVLAGLPHDRDWTVRSALATALGALPAAQVTSALDDLAADEDARVHGPALEALAAVKAAALTPKLYASLEAADFVERATAARLVGETRPPDGESHLAAAYTRGESDATYTARAAALEALSKYATDSARAAVRRGLSDRDWPVRTRAADLLRAMGEADARPVRPAPLREPADVFESAAFLHPAYLPQAYVDTAAGTIRIELNVTEAAAASRSFIELARAGFFNGMKIHRVVPGFVVQAGDPRGDGEGGPGYTLPDELGPLPYWRGTVGMALDGPDTGGSQWFITLAPQPHLEGHYTAFGRVAEGWDVLDRLSPWDVIDRVRIWDGVEFR